MTDPSFWRKPDVRKGSSEASTMLLILLEAERSFDHHSGVGIKVPKPTNDGFRGLSTTETEIDRIRIYTVKGFGEVKGADEEKSGKLFSLLDESLHFHDRGVRAPLPCGAMLHAREEVGVIPGFDDRTKSYVNPKFPKGFNKHERTHVAILVGDFVFFGDQSEPFPFPRIRVGLGGPKEDQCIIHLTLERSRPVLHELVGHHRGTWG